MSVAETGASEWKEEGRHWRMEKVQESKGAFDVGESGR